MGCRANAFLPTPALMQFPKQACHKGVTTCQLTPKAKKNFDPTLYLVTDRRIPANTTVEAIVQAAVTGIGDARVTTIQLRDKNVCEEDTLTLGRTLQSLCQATNTTFIINDSISLAQELNADGVHLGQEDESLGYARSILGEGAIIGISVGTKEEAMKAIEEGADYLGVGAVYRTGTKADAGDPIGVTGLSAIVQAVEGRVPVVAIGGIGEANVVTCAEAGANGVAVVSSIMRSGTPAHTAANLYNLFTGK